MGKLYEHMSVYISSYTSCYTSSGFFADDIACVIDSTQQIECI